MPSSCAVIKCETDVDEVDDEPPPVHIVVSAFGRSPPPTRATRTVFELAAASSARRALCSSHSPQGDKHVPRFTQALREVGAVRCIGGQYPSDRWTAEKEEKERARRARQRPPRPPKGARTKSKKLLELVGYDED